MPSKRDRSVRQFGLLLHAVGLIVLVAAACAVHYIVCKPLLAAATENRKEIGDLRRKIRKASVIRKEHNRLSDELKQLQKRSEAVRSRVPDEPRKDEFLAELHKISRESGITIDKYSEGKRVATKTSSYMLVNVDFTTGYVGFCRLLQRINGLQRIAFIEKLEMKEVKPGIYQFSLSLVLYYGLKASENEA